MVTGVEVLSVVSHLGTPGEIWRRFMVAVGSGDTMTFCLAGMQGRGVELLSVQNC